MDTFWTVAGCIVIAVILWEVFSDLFRPGGRGALSDWIGRMVFDASKRIRGALPLAGAAAVVTVIAVWIAALIVGFALVYYGAYPAGFQTSTGGVPSDSSRLLASLYFSFETLITLGYGDVVPRSMPIRFVANVEGLVGFGILTASVSSIVLLYPALARMRLLARGVSHIVEAERASGVSFAGTASDVALGSLARDVTRARIDLIHFPLVYFFVSEDPEANMAACVRELVRFAREASQPRRPDAVRLAARELDVALDELAAIVDTRFLHMGSRSRPVIFEALATDHLVNQAGRASAPPRSPARGRPHVRP